MRTAYEVFFNDTSDRASLSALAASDALFVIDNRKIVFDIDSTLRAGLSALSAGNATAFASFSRNGTLIVV